MSPLQTVHPLTEQSAEVDHPTQRLADLYPPRLFAEHLRAIFQIGKARFYELEGAGRFRIFELKPRIGRKAWSRDAVERYLSRIGEFAASGK